MLKDNDIYTRYKQGDKTVVGDLFKQYQPMISGSVGQYAQTGLSPSALDLEAKKLIINSLKTYDPSKGNITTHIQNNMKSMFRDTNKASQIYIPEARATMFRKYKDTYANMSETMGRDPSASEMASALKISQSAARRLSKETGSTIVPESDIYMSDVPMPTIEDRGAFIKALGKRIKDPTDMTIADMSFNSPKPSSNADIGKATGISEGAVRQRKDKLIKLIKGMG
jgi:DNA-directed RNA polymerase specialized sigma subunit